MNNREIKFRGKRVDNGQWVEGDLLHGVNHKSGKMFILPIRGGVMALGHGLDPLDGYEVTPESVGQYTGLKDKTGKEIYESDLVRVDDCVCGNPIDGFKDGVYKVEYCLPDCAFCLVQLDGKNAISFNECMEYEIIGSVFDNPELLSP